MPLNRPDVTFVYCTPRLDTNLEMSYSGNLFRYISGRWQEENQLRLLS